MRKQRVLYLLVLAAVVLSYILADRREPLVLLCLLILVPLVCALMQILAMSGLRLSFAAGGNCRTGQNEKIKLSISRKNRLPFGILRVKLVFDNRLFGDTWEKELCLFAEEKIEEDYTFTYNAHDCGEIQVCVQEAECYDLLGLFCWKRQVEWMETFVVYPPELKLSTEVSKRPATRSFGELYDPGRKGQDVSEVSGLRDYVNGDPLHSIHWKLSGKMDRLIVREFGYPSNYSTLILFETMKKNGETDIAHSCINAVMGLTVSLSYSLLQKGLEHDAGQCRDGEIRTIPVNCIALHENMVFHMMHMPLSEKGYSRNTVQSFQRKNIHNEYTKVVYITPVYDEQAVRELSKDVDLTVIHVVEKRHPSYAASLGYMLIPVSAEDYQNTVHNIVI